LPFLRRLLFDFPYGRASDDALPQDEERTLAMTVTNGATSTLLGGAPSPVVVRGARLVDGSGAPSRAADVALAGGRVVEIAEPGRLIFDDQARVVDADGLVLTPGFIDAHSHADAAPLLGHDDASKISQGVTTEVVGNCGFSLAPAPELVRDDVAAMLGRLFPALPFDWSTQAELNDRLGRAGYVVNAAPLIGQHTVRAAAMGMSDRPPTPAELEQMRRYVRDGLAEGAFGLSSGLIYPPGMYADVDEIAALATLLDERHVYSTHLRSESTGVVQAAQEALAVARAAGCRLQVSHLKAAGRQAWGRVSDVLALLDEATEAGVAVHHDVYPYEANSTMLIACLPPWFQDGGHEATMARLRDPSALARAEADLADGGGWENWVAACGWPSVLVASTATHRDEGSTMDRAAAARGCGEFAALVTILLENDLRATMSVFAMSPDDVATAMTHPRAMIGSDGLPPGTGGRPHPRAHGTFTRVLGRYVRDVGLFTLEQAVARMTSLPARTFGLAGRGLLRVGAVADAVLLDPERVADRATFEEPTLLSDGIHLVLLGGRVGFEHGRVISRSGVRLTTPARP